MRRPSNNFSKKQMPRNEFIPKILEILQSRAEATANLFDIFFSGYGESYKKMRRTINYGPPQFKTDWAFEYQQRQQFYSLLNQLKNQGLIEKKKSKTKKGSVWKLTKNGFKKLKLIKGKVFNFSKKNINYKKESDDKIKVVIFDVPEKERHKRTWLRNALIFLDFSLLQQSVWIGKSKIPEAFIYDLRKLEMLRYVQIFEINKKGTISQLP